MRPALSWLPVVELVLLVIDLAHKMARLPFLLTGSCASHHSSAPVFSCFLYWVRDHFHAVAVVRFHLEVGNHIHRNLAATGHTSLHVSCSLGARVKIRKAILHLESLTWLSHSRMLLCHLLHHLHGHRLLQVQLHLRLLLWHG